MSKLNLSLEKLRVESFQTAPALEETPATPVLAKMYGTSRCAFTECTCYPCVVTV